MWLVAGIGGYQQSTFVPQQRPYHVCHRCCYCHAQIEPLYFDKRRVSLIISKVRKHWAWLATRQTSATWSRHDTLLWSCLIASIRKQSSFAYVFDILILSTLLAFFRSQDSLSSTFPNYPFDIYLLHPQEEARYGIRLRLRPVHFIYWTTCVIRLTM